MTFIENPDGSLNSTSLYQPTEIGFPAEVGETYTFKIRYMGIEIEKKINVQDLSDWEWEVNDDGQTVTITNYKGNDTVVTFPSEINGMKVTEIGKSGSIYQSIWDDSICEGSVTVGCATMHIQNTIEKIIIPDGVLKLNDACFAYANKLIEVELPKSLTSIEIYAFIGCSSLNSINIPNDVESIGMYAFQYCSSLSSINIPDSVTSIDFYAFRIL